MSVPLSFLLGLAVVLLAGETADWLPGEATLSDLLLGAAFLPLPSIWIALATRGLVRARLGGRSAPGWVNLLLRTASLSVPLAAFGLVAVGGYEDFIERSIPESQTLRLLVLLGPILLLEAQLRLWIAHLMRRVQAVGPSFDLPFDGTSGPMVVLVMVAALLLAAAMDLLEFDPALATFLHATTLGTTLGLLLVVVLGTATLPLLFRFVLPTSRRLPPRLAPELHAITERLGFRTGSLLTLDTGLRLVNAALVGPLRWPRYLVLTDGILAYLDPIALRGVVAHEVGHARAGHPALLTLVFLVIPVFLLQPLEQIDLGGLAPGWLIAIGAVLALALLFAIRAVMHRFEYEADEMSAHALGGAEPCIVALTRVGDLFPAQRFRSSFRHPSEASRVKALMARESDPKRRKSFRRRGKVLRVSVITLALGALIVSGFAHAHTFRTDMAGLALYTSRFDDAEEWLRAAEDRPDADAPRMARLRSELDAAVALAEERGGTASTRAELADDAFARAIEVVEREGPAAARPYFALALSIPHDDPVRVSAWLWSQAADGSDPERADRLAAHLARLRGTPDSLRAAVTR